MDMKPKHDESPSITAPATTKGLCLDIYHLATLNIPTEITSAFNLRVKGAPPGT